MQNHSNNNEKGTYFVKLVLVALFLVFSPVLLVRLISTFVYSTSSSQAGRARLESTESSVTEEQNPIDQTRNYLKVNNDVGLDPNDKNFLLATVSFKVDSLPRLGKRQKLIAKYLLRENSSPGWAIALRRLSSSTRPEVYIKGSDNNKGGWYTFEKFKVRKDTIYNLTLVVRTNDSIRLYLQEFPETSGDMTATSQPPLFLGGYDLKNVPYAATEAPLEFAPKYLDTGEFRGEVKRVLLADLENSFVKGTDLKELIDGGVDKTISKIDFNSVRLLIGEGEKDYSRYARQVTVDSS